ncbi:DUF4402 domain-containing protein [Sphingomonas sp. SUN039]|uniref:DUF4402 domain-containing protein n=1 Tax=Sphingomonas sp. SUN039 TaxID=2937787 RepID=UPI0021649254|nr:DUF4402 domain-containing protein [Sphingomonas sp. SUN039]UVO55099.1 DUF4402 domain-containing protein [Sphingomonas sp. SUN039]
MGTIATYRLGRIAAACALAICSGSSLQAATQAANGKAITLRPLSIVKLRDLDFGRLASGTTAGTVVIDPTTDARSTTGGVLAAGGTPLAAQFYTYATGNQTLQVTRGPLPVLNRAGGGATMNVTQLTLNGPVLRIIGAAGLLDLRVGGTLAVAANQMDGTYSGNFDITVTYF